LEPQNTPEMLFDGRSVISEFIGEAVVLFEIFVQAGPRRFLFV
jgi:hypothetical protein